ncbi:hypothetical protein CHLRE_07g347100v5 [Chlamydomonas reinhardtii]|uniref:glucose-6-phosphate 1-epimerase n=1 Tax=Chlamydomonas reinhardtii TaxID=3055 RepID=A8ITZ0_CHLRE|nr:uncharacterized protein CHLRE_07g347100v5 [Chlamydomonas reinhardtii]PNW81222.1 hypothetical protein CHLRE_07g347100v5 [Chlamydomonas reinhardtii]|eukprot:XP_001692444.1 predicted protein [Chlamydomonas reinhardtii]
MDSLQNVTLKTQSGQTAVVSAYAGHLLSWTNAEGQDYIFMSKNAVFAPPKAIRGGVPVCFPQFSNFGPLGQQHGFVRNKQWRLVESNEWSVTLSYSYDGTEFPDYPYPFELTTRVELCDDNLEQTLTVKNTGSAPMPFTAALHTYYTVSDIANVSVEGLKGLTYLDSTDGRKEKAEAHEAVAFPGEVDRIYLRAPEVIKIHDSGAPGGGRTYEVRKRGFPDAVLWNPAEAKAAAMSDLGSPEWKRMVCLEPGLVVSDPVQLAAGESWSGAQGLRVHRAGVKL